MRGLLDLPNKRDGESEHLSRDSVLEPISLIYPKHPTYGVDIWISGAEGACNFAQLKNLGISTVVNCAVNLDFNYLSKSVQTSDPTVFCHGPGVLRYYKIGLVDGAGNPDTQMMAAHYILCAALEQQIPEKASYPRREKGNILINCRGGRSRSVIVVALFLHLTLCDEFPTIDAAIDFVRRKRRLGPDEWDTAPKSVLVVSAMKAAAWIRAVDQVRGVRA